LKGWGDKVNEELQQSLGELVTLVKSGISNLPPFLEKLSNELAIKSVINGSLGMLISLLLFIFSAFIMNKICRKEDLGEGDVALALTLGIVMFISAFSFIVGIQSVVQGLFAPTTVLIDYLQSLTK